MVTILFGYRTLGYRCLKSLIDNNCPPKAVVVPIDDEGVDGNFKSVKKLAIENKIKLFQPKKLKEDEGFLSSLKNLNPYLAFSCYFPKIIPNNVLSLFEFGGINIHGGILPDYRGTFSGVWAIINDERESGVTLHFMDDHIDTGDIIEIKKIKINLSDTGISLYDKTAELSLSLFEKYYRMIYNGEQIPRMKQKIGSGKYYKRKLPYDGLIKWSWNSRKIYNFTRALHFPPYKGALTIINGNEFEILSLRETSDFSTLKPGTIIETEKVIKVATKSYNVLLTKIKYLDKSIEHNDYDRLGLVRGNRFE